MTPTSGRASVPSMPVHNPRERRLFTDVSNKNHLSRQIRRLAHSVRQWRARMEKRRSKRWKAQYGNSIQRASAKLEVLERDVQSRAQELKSRIQEELEVSETEVQQFEEQHKKEVQELKAVRKELKAAEHALSGAENPAEPRQARKGAKDSKQKSGAGAAQQALSDAENLAELRQKHRRLERQAHKEAKDVKEVEAELASEARDEQVLTAELHRLLEEIEILRPALDSE